MVESAKHEPLEVLVGDAKNRWSVTLHLLILVATSIAAIEHKLVLLLLLLCWLPECRLEPTDARFTSDITTSPSSTPSSS